ncbi:MAG: cell division protein CrgA [Acidimicrobiales bacterium]
MATPPKKKPTGGRVTPKGTRPGDAKGPGATRERSEEHPGTSSRYTPPVPMSEKLTAPWVVPTMFGLLAAGALVIVVNYMDLLPGGTNNWYLFAGLGLILAGIITATRLH